MIYISEIKQDSTQIIPGTMNMWSSQPTIEIKIVSTERLNTVHNPLKELSLIALNQEFNISLCDLRNAFPEKFI